MTEQVRTMKTYRYERSSALFERASKVIPNGIYGHFNPAMQVPMGTYPFYAASTEAARFRDVDGNEFIDYMCAYGPMILGYGNPVVDAAYTDGQRTSQQGLLGTGPGSA